MDLVTGLFMKKPDAASSDPEVMSAFAENVRMARERAGLTQPQLAELIGMSQQGIASIESGKVARPRKLRELAKALRVSEAWLLNETKLLSEDGMSKGEFDRSFPSDGYKELAQVAASISAKPASTPNASFPPRYEPFGGARVPLMGQTQAGMNGRFVLNGQTVAEVFCPPDLEGVAGAYAVLVYGDSMEPKFEAGETVWLHPYLPVRRGDYVVAQIHDDENEAPSSYIKQFISKTGSVLTLKQFNPAEGEDEIMTFPADQVVSVHKIVFHKLP